MRIFSGIRGVRWGGDYDSWEKAAKDSTGYDCDCVLEKVTESALKVKKGEAVYERDSVLFDQIEYSWPLLSALMWIAARSGGGLNILDFGGSLGSTYFQNLRFLEELLNVQWSIVEQKAFVEAGRENFEDRVLKFYYDIDSCMARRSPNTIFFGSVISYLENPYTFLGEIKTMGFEYIIFDRTPFIHGQKDRLTVQRVPTEIYQAAFPCWFFSKGRFRDFFRNDYETIAEFESIGRANIPSRFEGCIMRKI